MAKCKFDKQGRRLPLINEENIVKVIGANADQGTHEYKKALELVLDTTLDSRVVLSAITRAESRGLIHRRYVNHSVPVWSLSESGIDKMYLDILMDYLNTREQETIIFKMSNIFPFASHKISKDANHPLHGERKQQSTHRRRLGIRIGNGIKDGKGVFKFGKYKITYQDGVKNKVLKFQAVRI